MIFQRFAFLKPLICTSIVFPVRTPGPYKRVDSTLTLFSIPWPLAFLQMMEVYNLELRHNAAKFTSHTR